MIPLIICICTAVLGIFSNLRLLISILRKKELTSADAFTVSILADSLLILATNAIGYSRYSDDAQAYLSTTCMALHGVNVTALTFRNHYSVVYLQRMSLRCAVYISLASWLTLPSLFAVIAVGASQTQDYELYVLYTLKSAGMRTLLGILFASLLAMTGLYGHLLYTLRKSPYSLMSRVAISLGMFAANGVALLVSIWTEKLVFAFASNIYYAVIPFIHTVPVPAAAERENVPAAMIINVAAAVAKATPPSDARVIDSKSTGMATPGTGTTERQKTPGSWSPRPSPKPPLYPRRVALQSEPYGMEVLKSPINRPAQPILTVSSLDIGQPAPMLAEDTFDG